jgi:hypothetical protein
MGKDAIVAGTGYDNSDGTSRLDLIRRHVREGAKVQFRREPHNPHDSNAIAVFVVAPRLFGLLGSSLAQIGYVKSAAAASLAAKMDSGVQLTGFVKSFYSPKGREHPRVSLRIEWSAV